MADLHVVTFGGPIGFVKPAAAVRDEETFSQRFLAPSTVEGMRRKLGVGAIDAYRLSYKDMSSSQTERVEAPAPAGATTLRRARSILRRRLLVEPRLHLGFRSERDADRAACQHLCLCRNEDVVLPHGRQRMTEAAFDALPGQTFVEDPGGDVLAGMNQYTGAEMIGRVEHHFGDEHVDDDDHARETSHSEGGRS